MHAIIVDVQTLLVNFVIANSIQGTIISIIALTCFFFFYFMSRTGDWSLSPLVRGAHSQMATPSRAVHVAAKI